MWAARHRCCFPWQRDEGSEMDLEGKQKGFRIDVNRCGGNLQHIYEYRMILITDWMFVPPPPSPSCVEILTLMEWYWEGGIGGVRVELS